MCSVYETKSNSPVQYVKLYNIFKHQDIDIYDTYIRIVSHAIQTNVSKLTHNTNKLVFVLIVLPEKSMGSYLKREFTRQLNLSNYGCTNTQFVNVGNLYSPGKRRNVLWAWFVIVNIP